MPTNHFYNRDIVSIKDFSQQDLEYIFSTTDKINGLKPNEKSELGKGRTLGYIFYEPSTRTRMSFEAAMASLGGSSIGIFDPKSSSIEKGESLADTIRTMDLYSDVIVLRHPLDGSSRFAGELSKNPIINAGSGSEEHPTQAMLDLYTIIKEKKKIDGLAISIVGDLKYGRTVYSLLYGLANYKVDVHLVSPPTLSIRKESIYDIANKLNIYEYSQLDDELLSKLDVIYVTRIQRERFPDLQEYEKVKGTYTINSETLAKSKSDVSIMHPMPRMEEISHSIDNTKNAIYFKQAAYGKELRAALLTLILNENIV
ncbi:MAG TPA: aspartate carbamoyltransferase [Nitrososphaeraceae archaeon]|jgi:aspartate carbamoyltransferase catalytic subunit|nr:aspartate carbamoyltransferase [Nitrososphaeraceae archaeon]HEX2230693.1 aspartate carbamoyltransferase [Nitrososphaeraceae archaeon]HZB15989.1 aspartate carbamoyltransferase [Nitrososphaeraceae archaeon]HZB98855.1 aspartate carbamoyltransferase [Nitrososphaeraceae archaeon]